MLGAGTMTEGLEHERRDLYRRWVKFADSIGTWAFEPGATLAEHQRQLDELTGEMDLLASAPIRTAVQNYIDHLSEGQQAVHEARHDTLGVDAQRMAAG